jgi:hypothetical protein
MLKFNEALLFPLADSVQMPLYLLEGKFRAHKEQSFKIGPWTLKSESVGRTDELGATRATLVVRIRKSLWVYLICDQQGQRLRCVMFDGDRAGLKSKDVDTFCTGKMEKTLGSMPIAAVVAGFEFKDEKWIDFDVSGNLVQRLAS